MILDKTLIFKVSPDLSQEDDIEKLSVAADIIKRGGNVCFPTETVYGLGANALCEKAVNDVFKAKGRPCDNPLIIHLDKIENAENYCFAKENTRLQKVLCFIPGPLTVILKKRECIPYNVTAGLENVAVRIPVNKVANKFLELCGVPVAAPSANISGRPSPTSAQHVISDLDGKVDAIIDSGPCDVGVESTVITLEEDIPVLLRPGAVTFEMLTEKLGKVNVSSAILSEMKKGDVACAPGMKYKHYAPSSPDFLVTGEDEKVISFLSEKQESENCAILCFSEDINKLYDKNLLCIGKKDAPIQQAQSIFSRLRETDALSVDKVYVHILNDKSGIRLAVFNRLLKASAFHIINV